MHLAIEALESKKTAMARELALEAVSHAEAAKAADPTCAQVSDWPFDPRMMSASAYAWYGQTIQTKAKAVDGGMEQVPDERYLRAH
ncbi:MAG: hypothetical protein SGPRY_013933, partial [Prymnesium sp.]